MCLFGQRPDRRHHVGEGLEADHWGKQDRNNVGNARTIGMQKDLGLTSNQFYNVLTMFCEPPSTICNGLGIARACHVFL